MTEMIERVARAIDPELFNFPKIELYRSNYEKVYAQARAAIEAMNAHIEAQNAAFKQAVDEAAQRPPNEKLKELMRHKPIWRD